MERRPSTWLGSLAELAARWKRWGAVAATALALLAVGACSNASSPSATRSPAAATADARAESFLGGNPVPTPTVAATALPRPSCGPGTLWWFEARDREGERVQVQGAVVEFAGQPGRWAVGQRASDPNRLILEAPGTPDLAGRTVCASGTVSRDADGVPVLRAAAVDVVVREADTAGRP